MLSERQKQKLKDYIKSHSWQECYDLYFQRWEEGEYWRVYQFWMDLGTGDDMAVYELKKARLELDKEILDWLKKVEGDYAQGRLC